MRPHPWPLLVALVLLATACGGGDPLPAAGSGEPPAAPGTPEPRRSITLVGLGNPPPEPPLRGDIEVEAVVRTDRPSWVEFYVDGAWVSADSRWPYMLAGGRYDTRRLPDGRHTLLARAIFPDETSIELAEPFWVGNGRSGQTARVVGQRLEVVVEDGTHDLAFGLDPDGASVHHWVVDERDFGRGCGDLRDLAVEPDVRVEGDRVVGEVRWSGRAADCGSGGGALAIDAPLARETR